MHRLEQPSFFLKCLKFDVNLKKREKIPQNVFPFLDICIWIRSCKFQIVQREYLSPAVNVLTQSRESSNITNKRDFLSQSLSEIQDSLLKVLSWRLHKCLWPTNMLTVEWCLLDNCVTMPFTICNFQNTQSTRVNLVSKCLTFDGGSRNWIKY